MIIQGDCLVKLKELEDNSVDSIVTDPPYELGFMGKSWDNTGIANNKEMWAECLRVLKPGGHLLAFSGTRTYHRMAVAIEDAGFEVRDMIEWVYGSGFPKSLNIGKILDKNAGNIKETTETLFNNPNKKTDLSKRSDYGYKFEPKSENAKQWEGWGTALKPSHETIAVAQKPFDNRSDIDYTKSICQTLLVEIALKSSELNLNEKTRLAIVRWTAEKNINTLEDLSEVMDMLQSELETNLNLNIVSSWLNILGEIWGAMSMFTTETKGSLTTELKILQSLEWENIFQNITQVKSNQISGYSANVLNVENLLNAVKLKLKYILTHSAQENAISQGNKLNFAPNHEPICMARKPLAEKTVAENCLKYGTGGINIDESRVESNEDMSNIKAFGSMPENKSDEKGFSRPWMHDKQNILDKQNAAIDKMKSLGRFPANLIHDGSEEVVECFPNESERFFKSIIYQAKASKSERNKGMDELEAKPMYKADGSAQSLEIFGSTDGGREDRKNNHPTVKPIALMEYLIKMVTPKFVFVCERCYNDKYEKQKTNSETSPLQKLRGGIQAEGQLSQGGILHEEMCISGCEDKQGKELPILQKDIHSKKDGQESTEILQPILCSTGYGNEKEGENSKNTERLFSDIQAREQNGEQTGNGNATQNCNGGENGEGFATNRDSSSHKSQKGRQQGREFNGNDSTGTQQNTEVKKESSMSSLSENCRCPNCGEGMVKRAGVVLDPFAGSGSTLVAAKQNGFQFIGIEMTPEYIPIIEARLKGIIKENTLF